MGVFRPTKSVKKITDITPEMLAALDVRAVLLDVDNTLASHNSHEPIKGTVEWTKMLTENGFKLIIVSNNYRDRVEPFAAQYGLEFITFAMKPLPFGYVKAMRRFGFKAKQCVIIGDQIFTDITGANLCGMKSVLVEPVENEDSLSFRIRRSLEKGLREKYNSERDV